MVRLKDPIPTMRPPAAGIEHQPLGEPKSLDMSSNYVATSGATVMTSPELANDRSAAVPPAPGFTQFGERVSHMTHHFVLSASSDIYRIWRFQSADPAIEFPVTGEGWALAWTEFRKLDAQAA
jgi:hypothetical protein